MRRIPTIAPTGLQKYGSRVQQVVSRRLSSPRPRSWSNAVPRYRGRRIRHLGLLRGIYGEEKESKASIMEVE